MNMGWRILHLQNPGTLKLKDNSLIYTGPENRVKVPLEDIDTVIIDNLSQQITGPLLSEFAKRAIQLIVCDEKHLPCGTLVSQNQFSRSLQTLNLQIKSPKGLQKRIWQKILQVKICNQAKVLDCVGHIEKGNQLTKIAGHLKSGDSNNREAYASRLYFPLLFGTDFVRSSNHFLNTYLNYGYSLVRSTLARTLCAYGFIPSMGLGHCNELNPFNLADDLIEPYRPMVDIFVYNMTEIERQNFKHTLLNLFQKKMEYHGTELDLLNGIEVYIQSLKNSFKQNSAQSLILPKFK